MSQLKRGLLTWWMVRAIFIDVSYLKKGLLMWWMLRAMANRRVSPEEGLVDVVDVKGFASSTCLA